MLVIVGSLDAGSRADVLAYARGLAESQVIAKDACFIDVLKTDGRWIFEIQEGGAGRSIARWINDTLVKEPDDRINIPLTSDRVATVSCLAGDLVTIVHPPSGERHASAMEFMDGIELGPKLTPFYGTGSLVKKSASTIFCISALFFVASAIALYFHSNAVDIGRFADRFSAANPSTRTTIENLPSTQLGLALKKIKSNSGYLTYLKLDKGVWSWAQTTASGAPAPKKESGAGNE